MFIFVLGCKRFALYISHCNWALQPQIGVWASLLAAVSGGQCGDRNGRGLRPYPVVKQYSRASVSLSIGNDPAMGMYM
jgi:hypothetical protein